MRGITIHAALLGIMLVLAYQAWTPNQTDPSTVSRDGDYTVWEMRPENVQSLTFERGTTTTIVERRDEAGDAYLWGTTVETFSPDSSGVIPEPTSSEFPLGDEGEDIWERVVHLRALRDLGVLEQSGLQQYGLDSTERRLTIVTSEGERIIEIGGTVFGNIHRYAFEAASGRGYVLSDQIVRALEGGQSSLRQQTLHRFRQDEVGRVTASGPSGERTMLRRPGPTRPADSWVSPETPDQPDQGFQNFINHVRQIAMLAYESSVSLDTMQFLVRMDYADEDGDPLEFMELYKTPTGEPDVWNYYLRTQTTRIPAQAHRNLAERVDRDLTDVFER